MKACQESIVPREVEIPLWDSFELTLRLTDPLQAGRLTYWFDLPHFGTKWLRGRFEITCKDLDHRYLPELNVELPIRQTLAAFVRDPDFTRRVIDWVDDFEETWHRSLPYISTALEATKADDITTLIPHFAPEFENPFFLRTCCDAIERQGKHELPRGLEGVSNVFDFYFKAAIEALNQRMGLVPKLRRVEKALATLTEAMVMEGSSYLPIDKVITLLESVHPSGGREEQNLYFQLENEGVLKVERVPDGDKSVEMVSFTFERLSDHRIAQRLLGVGSCSTQT